MKDSLTKFDLEDAFKALDEIPIPTAEKGIRANRDDLHETLKRVDKLGLLLEDFYDVNDSEDMNAASEERDAEVAKAKLARIEKIVDLDAETEDDILPSYVGKTIIQCPQCMMLFYKDAEDIERSEENPDVVNVNEVCQHCGNTSGYDVIGKVAEETEEAPVEETPAEDSSRDELGDGENDLAVEDNTTEEGETDDLSAEVDEDSIEFDLEEVPEDKEEEETNESLHNSKLLKDAEKNSDLKTENESEKLTLNEDIEDNLDAALKDHEEYIEYLRNMITQEEEALKKANNEQVKKAIQKRIDAFKEDLEAALPEAVKAEAQVEDLPDANETELTDATDNDTKEVEEVAESLNEAHQLSPGEKIIDENEKEILVKTTKTYGVYQVFNKSSVFVGSIIAIDDKEAKESWKKRKLESLKTQDKKIEEPLNEAHQLSPGEKIVDENDKEILVKTTKTYCLYQVFNKSSVLVGSIRAMDDKDAKLYWQKRWFLKEDVNEPLAESVHNSKAQKAAEEDSDLKTENESENKTLFEAASITGKENWDKFIKLAKIAGIKTMEDLGSFIKDNNVGEKDDIIVALEKATENIDESLEEATIPDVNESNINKLFSYLEDESYLEDFSNNTVNNSEEKVDTPAQDKPEDKTEEKPEVKVTAEIKKDITEADVKALTEISSIDDESFNDKLTESLKVVYENVHNFVMTDCTQDGAQFIVEGVITFNSGKTRPTKYIFEAINTNGTNLKLHGTNTEIFESCSMELTTKVLNEALHVSTIDYKYTVQGNLLEGVITK